MTAITETTFPTEAASYILSSLVGYPGRTARFEPPPPVNNLPYQSVPSLPLPPAKYGPNTRTAYRPYTGPPSPPRKTNNKTSNLNRRRSTIDLEAEIDEFLASSTTTPSAFFRKRNSVSQPQIQRPERKKRFSKSQQGNIHPKSSKDPSDAAAMEWEQNAPVWAAQLGSPVSPLRKKYPFVHQPYEKPIRNLSPIPTSPHPTQYVPTFKTKQPLAKPPSPEHLIEYVGRPIPNQPNETESKTANNLVVHTPEDKQVEPPAFPIHEYPQLYQGRSKEGILKWEEDRLRFQMLVEDGQKVLHQREVDRQNYESEIEKRKAEELEQIALGVVKTNKTEPKIERPEWMERQFELESKSMLDRMWGKFPVSPPTSPHRMETPEMNENLFPTHPPPHIMKQRYDVEINVLRQMLLLDQLMARHQIEADQAIHRNEMERMAHINRDWIHRKVTTSMSKTITIPSTPSVSNVDKSLPMTPLSLVVKTPTLTPTTPPKMPEPSKPLPPPSPTTSTGTLPSGFTTPGSPEGKRKGIAALISNANRRSLVPYPPPKVVDPKPGKVGVNPTLMGAFLPGGYSKSPFNHQYTLTSSTRKEDSKPPQTTSNVIHSTVADNKRLSTKRRPKIYNQHEAALCIQLAWKRYLSNCELRHLKVLRHQKDFETALCQAIDCAVRLE